LPDAHGEKGEPAARGVERSRGEVYAEWAAPAVPSRTASRHSRFSGRMGGMGTTVGSGVAGATASLRSVAAPFFMNRLEMVHWMRRREPRTGKRRAMEDGE